MLKALESENVKASQSEVKKRVVLAVADKPAKGLSDTAIAASLDMQVDEMYQAVGQTPPRTPGLQKAKRGWYGYDKKQRPKNSTWFAI